MGGNSISTLIGIGAYLIILIYLGVRYARRSNSSLEEYFLANRGFGPWVAAMSAEASAEIEQEFEKAKTAEF